MPYPLRAQLCMDTYAVRIFCQNVNNLLEENRNESLNPLDYGYEEHEEQVLFPSKCILRCHQTSGKCDERCGCNSKGAGFSCVPFFHKVGHACGP